jgi:hypothetical protein
MKIIRDLSIGTVAIVGFAAFIFLKYETGVTQLEKANSLCSLFYSSGYYISDQMIARFDPTQGHYAEDGGALLGRFCFFGLSHLNGGVNWSWGYNQTQIFNNNEYQYQLKLRNAKTNQD